MAQGDTGIKAISLQRLSLFKELQDIYNVATFLGINDNAVSATKLQTARNIDGVAFDGTENITLPTKVVQLWKDVSGEPAATHWYAEAAKTTEVTTFDAAKIYINMTDNQVMYWDGTELVTVVAEDSTPRIPMSMKGAANGVAELDDNGLVPSSQLPSYVDDVVDVFAEKSGEPAAWHLYTDSTKATEVTGETDKIYVATNMTTDGIFRYSGTQFVQVASTVSTAEKAIADQNGDTIDTTYVKIETGKRLMTDEEGTQLATLWSHDYTEATENEIRGLFDSTTLATYDAAHPVTP